MGFLYETVRHCRYDFFCKISGFFVVINEYITIFVAQTVLQEPRSGVKVGRDAVYILKSVYSTLFLGFLKLRNFQSLSRMQQTVDCFCGYVKIHMRQARERRSTGVFYIVCVRLLRLLVLQ